MDIVEPQRFDSTACGLRPDVSRYVVRAFVLGLGAFCSATILQEQTPATHCNGSKTKAAIAQAAETAAAPAATAGAKTISKAQNISRSMNVIRRNCSIQGGGEGGEKGWASEEKRVKRARASEEGKEKKEERREMVGSQKGEKVRSGA